MGFRSIYNTERDIRFMNKPLPPKAISEDRSVLKVRPEPFSLV